ncbi:Histidine kinase [Mucilaginibacter mallensis]|uniref:Histidine kinase n=1 Tax=Mucilaginibacter mallensis TaxID=652787 RepID=A0A1H1UMX7_MUCMA|nr:histidine kinase [Mucilaginibacter mallensis]SDS73566.1 Histidine kinase [Mucilaginibacter mallensis]
MPIPKIDTNWLIRYKLYHIPFWCVYHFIWWSIAIGNPLKAASYLLFTPMLVKFSFYVIFQAIAVYFNLYFLIPRYLEKSRFVIYIILLLSTVAITSLLITPGYYLSAFLIHKSVIQAYGGLYNCLGEAIPSTLASMTLAMSIKLTKNWLQTTRRQQLLEKEKLETELKFLKYQFNPHFLFNSINSIFFLIHKNPDMASDSLARFSELLRHQLYECNDRQIPLSKELDYLENFIGLEKLRQHDDLEVALEIDPGPVARLGIAPFILMTFVENAFKHVSRQSGRKNWININIRLNGLQLEMDVDNSTWDEELQEVINYGGIGLKNVRRRLELLYPGQYELSITQNTGSFAVRFKLMLSELELSPSFELMA